MTANSVIGGRGAGQDNCGGFAGPEVIGTVPPSCTAGLLARLALLLAVALGPLPAAAQDGDLDGIPLLPRDVSGVEDVSSRSFQIYRIPIAYTVRPIDHRRWGMRLTLPVSLGTYELQAATDLGDVVESIQSVAVIPGVELLLPVGERWLLKPFGEVGVGDDSRTGETHLLYATGVRARAEYTPRPCDVLIGLAYTYRNDSRAEVVANWYSTVEGGVAARIPLGFNIGARQAEGGIYGILRHYSDLELDIITEGPFAIEWTSEVGLTFSTDPILRVWKIKLPWIGVGYRFGDHTRGVRLSFGFPF